METADCLDGRLFWAAIWFSWCGPQPSEYCVLKDKKGWIKTDAKGDPIPAKLKDLRESLGLSPGMTGNVSRAAARLEAVGSIRFGDRISGSKRSKLLYIIKEPTSPDSSLESVVQTTLKVWHIGTKTICTDKFAHLDAASRTELEADLDDDSTAWLSDLKAVRTKADERVVQTLSRRGILIERSLKSKEAKSSSSLPSSNGHKPDVVEEEEETPLPKKETPTPTPPEPPVKAKDAEPVPTFDDFRREYPPSNLDPRSKPAFVKLKPREKIDCVKALPKYRASERWNAESGRFIPRASRFIAEEFWKFDPGPLLRPLSHSSKLASEDEVLEYLRKTKEVMR